jgi:hypothetical protein
VNRLIAMKTTSRLVALAICGASWCAAAALEGSAAAAQNVDAAAGALRSIWDGVYTEAQAARGETVYVKACETCHMAGLDGDAVEEIPALVFDAFMARWNGESVGELQRVVGRSMPKDAPGSLGPQAYADVVAFILSKNDAPAGRTPLDRDPQRARDIRIERKK